MAPKTTKSSVYKLSPEKMQGKKLHIVDVSAVTMAYYYNEYVLNASYVVDGVDVNTKALFGLFKLFRTYQLKNPDNHFIFCFDAPGNTRKDEYDGYKEGRACAPSDYFRQHELIYNILKDSKFLCARQEGFEADDFVVYYADHFKSQFDHVFLHTHDKDLAQAIDDNVYFINAIEKYADIDVTNFAERLKCPYNAVLLHKALVGDSSDRIKGIKGFGPRAFDRFIDRLANETAGEVLAISSEDDFLGVALDFSRIRRLNLERQIIETTTQLTPEQKEQALSCLDILVPRFPNQEDINHDLSAPDLSLLRWYLEKYGIASVVKTLD